MDGIESNNVYNCKDKFHNNSLMREKLKNTAKISPNYGGRGREKSSDCKKKISNSNKKRRLLQNNYKEPWNKGLTNCYTDEARYKMGASNRGKHLSEETKYKIGLGNKGKIVSKETGKKISLAKKGKPGYKKYSQELVDCLREQHLNGKSFRELSREYNINHNSIACLVKYGQAAPAFKFKRNDYPEEEYKSSDLEVKINQEKFG